MKKTTIVGLLGTLTALAQQPKFEIADVHFSKTAKGFAQNFGGVLREGKYVNRDATMLELIEAAYGIKEDSISGGPGWVNSDVYDVIAKVPDGTTAATAKIMLQGLLADRFNLVTKTGESPVPRYVLTVGKGGAKLKPGTGAANCQPQQNSGNGGNPADPASIPNIKVTCHNLTSAAIGENRRQMAGGYLDHDVVDSTGLEGTYDFDIEWTGRGQLAAKGADGISVFDAVEKQLGLKLEKKDIPLPALAIVSVNRKPSANPPGFAGTLTLAEARFEAATIKPADPNARPFYGLLYTGGSQMKAGGTLRSLIAMSLQIPGNVADDMVSGLPKSADTQRWEILAKVPAEGEGAPHMVNGRPQPPPFSVALEMLRGLLLEDFGVKTHTENREVTVYALTVAKGKPKMTQAAETERSGCRPDPNAARPVKTIQVMIGCKNTSMADLAQNLQQMAGGYIDHPIVDATGLEGGWNYLLGWTGKSNNPASPAPANTNGAAGAAAEASDPDTITVFEAVESQLGLKLVKQKRSIPIVIVDHVDEKPKQ